MQVIGFEYLPHGIANAMLGALWTAKSASLAFDCFDCHMDVLCRVKMPHGLPHECILMPYGHPLPPSRRHVAYKCIGRLISIALEVSQLFSL
ncbi:hypothetical protein BVC80_479g48 [Macleaya cordata]|uniref:Uncharacterized protein n=1 Tax=Macleaya cordata TaxID=56857 RepID=A0A200Q7P6_MACCD|nr:hypothetical protein BVC80_479g48 [Macleaya cordata]